MRSVCFHRVSMQPPQEETHGARGLQGRSTDAAFSLSYGQEVFYHFTVLQTPPPTISCNPLWHLLFALLFSGLILHTFYAMWIYSN